MKMDRVLWVALAFALTMGLNSEATERYSDSRSPRFGEALLARGEPACYQGERLEAISMPMGGLGAGCIQFNGKAERHIWQIFNNLYPVSFTHSFCRKGESRPATLGCTSPADFSGRSFCFDQEPDIPGRISLRLVRF